MNEDVEAFEFSFNITNILKYESHQKTSMLIEIKIEKRLFLYLETNSSQKIDLAWLYLKAWVTCWVLWSKQALTIHILKNW